jgi:hypothetical protein
LGDPHYQEAAIRAYLTGGGVRVENAETLLELLAEHSG